ncbi:hypothetical protein GR11A_00121 [Vibrio phage vB_VcorM_GR11A]|nr:hypothetical protein GR11A_00121 [Vibrio phage vB_VcorM_GR11A]
MKTISVGSLTIPATSGKKLELELSSTTLEEAAVIDNYKKGDRVIINVGTAKKPEYYTASVTKLSRQTNTVYVRFDDGEKWQYKATKSQVGIMGHASRSKSRVKAIKPNNLNKWLKDHPDAPEKKGVVGKGTVKRPAKPSGGARPAKESEKVQVKPSKVKSVPVVDTKNMGGAEVKKEKKMKKPKITPVPSKPVPAKVQEYRKTYRRFYETQLELHMLNKYVKNNKADVAKIEKKQRKLQQELVDLERASGDPAACNRARKDIIISEAPKITKKLEEKYADEIKDYTPSWV